MSDETTDRRYVKCRVCDVGMDERHAAAHIRLHMDAGDLIRAAHQIETGEL